MENDKNPSKDAYLDRSHGSFDVLYDPDLQEELETSVSPFTRLRPSSDASPSRPRDPSERNPHTWTLFQEAASNTSKLYQARSSGRDGHWLNFQNAASSITMLYKESLEQQQKYYDAGYRAGVEKAYNELVEWLVEDPRYHSRKHIRTDDLLGFIYSPKNPAAFAATIRSAKSHERNSMPTVPPCSDHQNLHDLEAFRDALSVSSLDGAMSHFSVNRSPPRHSHGASPPRSTRPVDLHAFVTEEFRRHKRSSSAAFNRDDEDDGDLTRDLQSSKRRCFSPAK